MEEELERRLKVHPKDARLQGLKTKLSPLFGYRIFSKPEIAIGGNQRGDTPGGPLRLDFSKLPAALQYLSSNALLGRILRERQLAGPQALSTYLLVDESHLCAPWDKPSALRRVAAEGRKFGLGLVVGAQGADLLPREIVLNTFTKIVLRVDKTEIRYQSKEEPRSTRRLK